MASCAIPQDGVERIECVLADVRAEFGRASEIARQVGVTRSAIAHFMNGNRTAVRAINLLKLADALGVDMRDLVEWMAHKESVEQASSRPVQSKFVA